MTFLKFLFHKNYHHHEEHDSSLPATNLHSIRVNQDLEKVIKHQMDALLGLIIQTKRHPKKYMICNPAGILLYAKSLLYVFDKNGFFADRNKLDFYCKFIAQQKEDFEIFSSGKKTIFNFFLSQKNILATFTIALSILLAVFKTLDFFQFNEVLKDLDANEQYKYRVIIVSACLALASLFHRFIVDWHICRGGFRIKQKRQNILNHNSDIKKGKFSLLYRFRLLLIGMRKGKIVMKKVPGVIISIIFWFVGLIIFIATIVSVWLYCAKIFNF
jgi:hypothetical protein